MAKRHSLALAAMLFCLAAASTASAQTCTTDADCLQGFSCVVSGTSASTPCKGADCASTPPDDPIVYKSCQPKACSADADCGAGMVCHEETSTACSGSGGGPVCAPNGGCDAGPVTVMETCTTTSRKLCAFKWELPCNVDSDCGAEFICNPSVSGICSAGSGSAPPASTSGGTGGTAGTDSRANTAPAAVDASAPVCTTTTSFPGWCAPKATTCATNSDCPSGWTCTTAPMPEPAQTRGSQPANDGGAATPALFDAGATTTPAVKQCVGPYGYGYPTRGVTDGNGTGTSSSSGGTAGAGGGTSSPVPPAGSSAGGPTGTDYGPHGGCAVGPAHGGSAFALLGFAALLLAYRRRRA
jgi:MYXO-CTERM domain-containing protein